MQYQDDFETGVKPRIVDLVWHRLPPEAVRVAECLRGAQSVVVLTGAGMSQESGVPTFRDAQTGLWAEFDRITSSRTGIASGNITSSASRTKIQSLSTHCKLKFRAAAKSSHQSKWWTFAPKDWAIAIVSSSDPVSTITISSTQPCTDPRQSCR